MSIQSILETMAGTLERDPVTGPFAQAAHAGRDLGAAVYDGVTGDRDGAVDHGARALIHGARINPGINAAMTSAEGPLGIASSLAGLAGVDGVPKTIEGLAGSAAVAGTNFLFGADETPGTGTAQGETIAGMAGMGLCGLPVAGIAGPAIAPLEGWGMTEADQLLGDGPSDRPGSTSTPAQRQAAQLGQRGRGMFDHAK